MAANFKRRRAARLRADARARLPSRFDFGAWLGGDETAEADEADRRLQEEFAQPLDLSLSPFIHDPAVAQKLAGYKQLQAHLAEPYGPASYDGTEAARQLPNGLPMSYWTTQHDNYDDERGLLGQMLNPAVPRANALESRLDFPLPPPVEGQKGNLNVYEPSLRENITYWIYDGLKALGASRNDAEHFSKGTSGLLGYTPADTLPSLDDAGRAYERGDYLEAIVAGAGAIPIVGKGAKPLKGVAKDLGTAGVKLAEDLGAAGGELAEDLGAAGSRLYSTLFESVDEAPRVAQRAFVDPADAVHDVSDRAREALQQRAARQSEAATTKWVPTLFEPVERRLDIPQRALPRYVPPRGVSARVNDVINDPAVRKKVMQIIEAGLRMHNMGWYETEPLRLKFIEVFGDKDKGEKAFHLFTGLVAATSARSDVGTNIRNASYYYHRIMKGLGTPEVGSFNPKPYGHAIQHQHQKYVERAVDGGLEPLRFPKMSTNAENLRGNLLPITVDVHGLRLPGMLAEHPSFLRTRYKDLDGVYINPRALVERGDISMEEALKHPGLWDVAPRANEYGALESYYQGTAREVGVDPATGQGGGWVGGGALTGLRTDPHLPWLGHLEDRVYRTVPHLQASAEEVLRRVIRGDDPLLTLAALAMGISAVGGLPQQKSEPRGSERVSTREPRT